MKASWQRYARVARAAKLELPDNAGFQVIDRVKGGADTDFGVIRQVLDSDYKPVDEKEAARTAALLDAGWSTFDKVVSQAPASLRKGPRGGGRDRDKIMDHVLGAEVMYARKIGLRIDQPAMDDKPAIRRERKALLDVVGSPWDGKPFGEKTWPPRYAARRIAWHVLDHAWEIEDRST
jgi:hypothetical protein